MAPVMVAAERVGEATAGTSVMVVAETVEGSKEVRRVVAVTVAELVATGRPVAEVMGAETTGVPLVASPVAEAMAEAALKAAAKAVAATAAVEYSGTESLRTDTRRVQTPSRSARLTPSPTQRSHHPAGRSPRPAVRPPDSQAGTAPAGVVQWVAQVVMVMEETQGEAMEAAARAEAARAEAMEEVARVAVALKEVVMARYPLPMSGVTGAGWSSWALEPVRSIADVHTGERAMEVTAETWVAVVTVAVPTAVAVGSTRRRRSSRRTRSCGLMYRNKR